MIPSKARAAWDGAHPAVRWGAVLALVVVVLNALAAGTNAVLGNPSTSGPESSTYVTGPHGLAAYAELLSDHGHPVDLLRSSPSAASLDPRATVVILDPGNRPDDDEARALKQFVMAGGRLVAGGEGPQAWLGQVLPRAPVWSALGTTSGTPLAPLPEVAGVFDVRAAGSGSWAEEGGSVPALGDATLTMATIASLGTGRVMLLADTSILQNRFIAQSDNAALGLGLAGGSGRPVVFAEVFHGYGEASGFDALPSRWKWVLGGLVLAALTWIAARSRRLGPPEDEARILPPPRRVYVDALATTLAKAGGRAEAIDPLRRRAHVLLASRIGVPPGSDELSLRNAALDSGLTQAQTNALFETIDSDEKVLAVGRAFAHLTKGSR